MKTKFDILNPAEDAQKSVSTTLRLIISALTLVSALAWNEAIKGLFELMKADPLLAKAGVFTPFIYAILVTVLTVYIINRLEKLEDRLEKKLASLTVKKKKKK